MTWAAFSPQADRNIRFRTVTTLCRVEIAPCMTPTLPDVPKVEIAIIEMTNAFRREHKLGEVRPSPALARAAHAYADYLARSGTFSHTADGREPSARAESAGYQFCQIAENLALNLDSRGFEARALASQAVEGWKNSPGHRKNLLAPHVVEIGVGVARAPDKDPKYISVQLFGRPKSMVYQFKVANVSAATVSYSFGGETHALKPRFAATHSACVPDEIAFMAPETAKPQQPLKVRYTARDGQVYTLKPAGAGGLTLEVSESEGAKPRAAR